MADADAVEEVARTLWNAAEAERGADARPWSVALAASDDTAGYWRSIAEIVLGSPWLAEHDREVAEKAIRDASQEWEFAAGYQGDNGIELRWFSLSGAYVVREAAEHELAKYDGDPSVRLVRRPAPGPWEPVVTEPAGVDRAGCNCAPDENGVIVHNSWAHGTQKGGE